MDEKTIKKGSVVNALGIGGKALLPLLFILIARLFGPQLMGVFFLAFVAMDFAFNVTLSGLKDGVVVFVSRHTHSEDEEKEIYRVLANAIAISVLISLLIVLCYYVVGNRIVLDRYPDGRLAGALGIMVWSLPFFALLNIVTSGTKGLLIMKWEAVIIGFLRPLFFCIGVIVVALLNKELTYLAYGYLIANVLLFLIALVVFLRQFQLPSLIAAFQRPFWNKNLLKFIIPQNLHTSFNTLITNLDVMMLALFKTNPELIGYYGMGAQIARNIRQVKIAFAGILGPIITRLHRDGNYHEMTRLFSLVVSWIISIALPLLFVIALFRSELLQLFHQSFTGDAYFILLLLIPAFLSCLIGMAGDFIVMTGHVIWNLINSATLAALNFILNIFMIPAWGLIGAAAATAISASIVYLLTLAEAHFLLSVRLRPKVAFRPFLYLILPAVIFALLMGYFSTRNVVHRILITAVSLLLYIAIAMYDRKRNELRFRHQT